MTIGCYQRATPKLRILRGDIPTLPSQRSQRHAPKPGEDILSGMLISYKIADQAWVKGLSDGAIPFLAREDDTEYDVLASGVLTGLSLADPVRVQTAFFVSGVYVPGDLLTPATGGDVGKLKVGASGDPLVGIVSPNGVVDINGIESGVVVDGDGAILVLEFDSAGLGAVIP
jgi:hypothetical protein